MKHTLTILIMLLTFTGFSRTVYIDPSRHELKQDGTQQYPYDSWQDVTLSNGNVYLQKRGTTYTSSAQIYVADHSVTIGAYGTGNRPIFSYTGTSYAIRFNASYGSVSDFEINGNGSAFALIGSMGSTGEYWQFNKINNCLLHNAHNPNNAGFGVYIFFNSNLKILNTEIRNVALDGIFLQDCFRLEIGYCKVIDINRRYFLNANESVSSGDGIQLVGYYNGFWIHHTTIDRTNGALNKYSLILNSAPGKSDNATGILEYNTFINSAGIYSAILIERGANIITRYNSFLGASRGIRLGGVHTKNNLIQNNTFTNCTMGVVVGYSYSGTGTPSVGPCIGTKVYNNSFKNTGRHITADQTTVETCGNTSDGIGTPEYNYNTGQFNHVGTCKN